MSVVAPILNVLSVLLDVLQLSGALLISRHHLLLWLLISHLSVLLAQAEFLFCFVFWCLSYLYWDSFLLLIKTVFFFQIFGSMGLCLNTFIKSALKFANPTSGSTWSLPFSSFLLTGFISGVGGGSKFVGRISSCNYCKELGQSSSQISKFTLSVSFFVG